MSRLISFNELRRIKDRLPDGSMEQIARKLGVDSDTVRSYFGGTHGKAQSTVGVHIEQGPEGGMVRLDDVTILEMAIDLLGE